MTPQPEPQSKTPRTDNHARVYQTAGMPAAYRVVLDLARQLETELIAQTKRAEEAEGKIKWWEAHCRDYSRNWEEANATIAGLKGALLLLEPSGKFDGWESGEGESIDGKIQAAFDAASPAADDVSSAMTLLGLNADKIFDRIRQDLERGLITEARSHLNFVDTIQQGKE